MYRFSTLIAGALLVAGAVGCASSSGRAGARAALDDPRMKCAELELVTKGYQVDPSFRRPGRLLATRQFTGGNYYRAAITAAIDTTDNTFDLWTRYIRPDETTVTASPAPTGRMMLDAMEIEGKCTSAK
ncbi:MAG: hypothetical protein ABI852_08435 [Gemmatimonadaceae bacterium]